MNQLEEVQIIEYKPMVLFNDRYIVDREFDTIDVGELVKQLGS